MSSLDERIEKLRALAGRPGTPAEGDTARRLADELEAKRPRAPRQTKRRNGVRPSVGMDSAERKRRDIVINIDPSWLLWGLELAWEMAKAHRAEERKEQRRSERHR